MADIQVTDQLDRPVENIKVDLAHPSSLLQYLKTEALHVAVAPDFLERKDKKLTEAATRPIRFQASAQHQFQLLSGNTGISVTPGAQATVRVNASPGGNLFEDDSFRLAATVPSNTGYVSVAFEGSIGLEGTGSTGNLRFGFDDQQAIDLEYLKAFPLGAGEPTLGDALGASLSSYVIPASLDDLAIGQLGVNDIATARGEGTLTVSGSVSVTAAPNPLASVDLPLGAGTIAVKAGVAAGLSASLTISGSYQVRARRKSADTIELSFLQQSGTRLKAGISASGGVSVKFGDKDLASALLGAISTDPKGDQKLLTELQPEEREALTAAIKTGVDHSLQASLNAALARITDDQAAFQYEIQPALLNADARAAVNQALRGDLSGLTALEGRPGGKLAPGLTMLNSVFSDLLTRETTLKVNLLGIFNYITVSDLIRAGEVLTDPATGDVTIKDKTTSTQITAIREPLDRVEPLRKALFNSVVLTTTYIASKAVSMPGFACTHAHFALNARTGRKQLSEYLNWFEALNLVTAVEKPGIGGSFVEGGTSTCVLRTAFGDAACLALFFDANGQLCTESHYLEYGRRALRGLLQPDYEPYDRYRYALLGDAAWPEAVKNGPVQDLGPLVGLAPNHPAVSLLEGDVYSIATWAEAMRDTGEKVRGMREFLKTADPATLDRNPEFQKRRKDLQGRIASMLRDSRLRFSEPWGMVALFWAAGSPQPAYGRIVRDQVLLERGTVPVAVVAAQVSKAGSDRT